MAKLVLLRHGKSLWNMENKFTGWVDIPLTDKGREEARRAGEKLKGIQFHKAYTSLLQRAQETLTIVLEVINQENIKVEKDIALNERHYGDLQGLNKAETAKRFGDEQVHLWRRSYDIAPPNGESLKDTGERTLPYFKDKIMKDCKEGRSVLISAHGNSLRSIVMFLDKLSKDDVLHLNIATGVPILYDFDDNLNILSKKIMG
ncbi:MAG: 2,3-diphosphoglycerate-dependent phosphoglycerate mutase [Nitrospirota bacterium]